MTKQLPPTDDIYQTLVNAYSFFNENLFDGMLPTDCVISIRARNRTMGYFSANRFAHREEGRFSHEIAFNPEYFGTTPIIETMQTLVHEMAHEFQYIFGEPSRKTYHNKEWADLMESMGLIPSSTGMPGGSRTGQKMADYPKTGGKFELLCRELFQDGCYMRWYDRVLPIKKFDAVHNEDNNQNLDDNEMLSSDGLDGDEAEIVEQLIAPVDTDAMEFLASESSQQAGRQKFQCPECLSNIWAKPSNESICGLCFKVDKKIVFYGAVY